jgi:hypothetical protein
MGVQQSESLRWPLWTVWCQCGAVVVFVEWVWLQQCSASRKSPDACVRWQTEALCRDAASSYVMCCCSVVALCVLLLSRVMSHLGL